MKRILYASTALLLMMSGAALAQYPAGQEQTQGQPPEPSLSDRPGESQAQGAGQEEPSAGAGPSITGEKQADVTRSPPGGKFRKVSELTDLPEFVPGLGVLYVQPDTMPVGPFLAYDRDGTLLSTVYMLPMAQLQQQRNVTGLSAGTGQVNQVDVTFNPGHPGLPEPHYHVVMWHAPKAKIQQISEIPAETERPGQQTGGGPSIIPGEQPGGQAPGEQPGGGAVPEMPGQTGEQPGQPR